MKMNPVQTIDLSPTQRVVWYGQKFHADSPIYNTAYAFRFLQTINPKAFSRAHERLIESTDSFKMTFSQADNKLQCFSSSVGSLSLRNCTSLTDAEFETLLVEETSRKLDLATCPWRSTLFERANGKYVWHLLHHHLLTDGIGFQVVLRRAGQFYQEELGLSPSSNLGTFPSFANWISNNNATQINPSGNKANSSTAQHSNLYSAKAPTGAPSGERHTLAIRSELEDKLDSLIKQPRFESFSRELSLNFIFLTSVFSLLSRIERRPNICIGIANHGRTSREEREIAGLLVSIRPMSITVDNSDSFALLYEKVRDTYFQQASKNADNISNSNHEQDYDVTFNFLTGNISDFGGIPVQPEWVYPNCHESANRWRIHYINTSGSNSKITCDFNDEAFSSNSKQVAMRNLVESVSAFAEDPDQKVSSFSLAGLNNSDGSILIGGKSQVPQNVNLWNIFKSKALESSSTVAIKSDNSKLTYCELLEAVEQCSNYLLTNSIETGDLIPIIGQRSSKTIEAALSAMKVGGAFLPIDSRLPKGRIDTIISDSQARITIDTNKQASPSLSKSRISDNRESNTAYVIYTSGTTGVPNGVAVGHRSVLNLLQDMEGRAPLQKGSRCMWWTAVNFDLSIYEVFSAILYGHTLHIPPDDIHMNADKLFEWIEQNQINSAYLPPFMLDPLNTWLDRHVDFPLKRLLVGVEPIQEELLVSIAKKVGDLRIVNGYGPTEATVCSTFYSIDPSFNGIRRTPIGRPLAGNRCYVLDQQLNLMSKGTVGELYIAGTGLAHGYWQRPELNAARYIRDPFNDKDNKEVMYKTGDLVRLSDEDQLEFIGRVDSQIKLRGQRIEPAEIEQTMASHAQIQRCIATLAEIGDQEELVCYYTSPTPIGNEELYSHASYHLPFQLLPKQFFHFTSFPTTTNGKVDFAKLLKLGQINNSELAKKGQARQLVAPMGPVEEHVFSVWSEMFKTQNISTKDSFFQLGGTSLDAMEVTLQICNDFEVDIPLHTIFTSPSIIDLSAVIERKIEDEIGELSDEEADEMLNSNTTQ